MCMYTSSTDLMQWSSQYSVSSCNVTRYRLQERERGERGGKERERGREERERREREREGGEGVEGVKIRLKEVT